METDIFNRTPDDTCLLCHNNKATKTKSHIISKFLGNELKKYNNNRLKLISSDKKSKPEQDLPEANYLYCPDCENKFGIIETEVSRILLQINKISYSHNFTLIAKYSEEYMIKNNKLEPALLYLFMYIQVWRTSSFVNNLFDKTKIENVNNYRIFEYFRLNLKFEDNLRTILNENLFLRKAELINNLEMVKHKLSVFPFVLFTHKGNVNLESRYFYTNTSNEDTALLYMNNFKLVMFFNNNIPNSLGPYINSKITDANITILSKNTWQNLDESFKNDFWNWNKDINN